MSNSVPSTDQEFYKYQLWLSLLFSLLIQKSQKQGMYFNFIKLMSYQQHKDTLMVYVFPIAIVTKYHEFGGLKYTILEARDLKCVL